MPHPVILTQNVRCVHREGPRLSNYYSKPMMEIFKYVFPVILMRTRFPIRVQNIKFIPRFRAVISAACLKRRRSIIIGPITGELPACQPIVSGYYAIVSDNACKHRIEKAIVRGATIVAAQRSHLEGRPLVCRTLTHAETLRGFCDPLSESSGAISVVEGQVIFVPEKQTNTIPHVQ